MYAPLGVKIDNMAFPIPACMKAWVLGGPEELRLVEKPVPLPHRAEVLVRIDAVASVPPTLKSSAMARRR
jgi:L-iditol 2-dehydrogenase